MKIAVTGGSGAIGRYVCDELMRRGHQVRCLDRTAPDFEVEFRQVDLTGLEETRRAIARSLRACAGELLTPSRRMYSKVILLF